MSDTATKQKTSRNKNILRIEERLTYLVENDIRNEEIYKLLKSLAHIYIGQNKFYSGYFGVEDVCHDVAADVWMSVINGTRINAWMYYIGKMIKLSYVTKQKQIEHEVISVEDDPDLRENIKRMCASSSMSCIEDFDNMERNFVLDNIGGLILDTMDRIKFKKFSLEWSLIYCNVCINLVRELYGEEHIFFRLPAHLQPYVSIVMEQFKKNFRNSGFTESISDNVEDDLEMSLTASDNYLSDKKG